MSFGFDIDLQFLRLNIVFRSEIKDIDTSSGEFSQDIHKHSDPVLERTGDNGSGVIAGPVGKFRSQKGKTCPIMRNNLPVDQGQAMLFQELFGINNRMACLSGSF